MFRSVHILLLFSALLLALSPARPSQAQAFTSGAASMRIDVEVYKGPLAKDIRSQLAEFLGLLEQTKDQIERLNGQMEFWGAQQRPGCFYNVNLLELTPGNKELIQAYECRFLSRLLKEAQDLNSVANKLPGTLRNAIAMLNDQSVAASNDGSTGQAAAAHIRATAVEATAFAKQISRSAQNWQEIQTAVVVPSPQLRALMTSFQFAASEQANQIASRADALVQQIDGLDRRELPLSAFIAGSAPTDFARLFEWNDAYLYSPTQHSPFGDRVEDRTKILERLQADMHWARVNTVYASGRGDTAMAFIKDDIGNWSLKQFDNDAGELLKAYTGVAKAALVTATSLIADAGTAGGASGVKQLVNLADSIAFGSGAAPEQARAPIDLQPVRERLQARLKTILEDAQKKELTPGVDMAALRQTVETDIRNALESYKAMLDLVDEATASTGATVVDPFSSARDLLSGLPKP